MGRTCGFRPSAGWRSKESSFSWNLFIVLDILKNPFFIRFWVVGIRLFICLFIFLFIYSGGAPGASEVGRSCAVDSAAEPGLSLCGLQ